MRFRLFLLPALAGSALLACAGSVATGEGAVTPSSGPGELPASWVGELPCADCDAIRHRLNLFPDGAYFLERTYLGRADAVSVHRIGRWTLAPEGGAVVLHGDADGPASWGIVDGGALRMRDREGREIDSRLNYTLARTEPFDRVVPRLAMRGMYRYMADAGVFTECLTGQRWPVVQEADNAALERAYAAMRHEPGEELLVSVEGRAEPRAAMEGPAQPVSLVVERFAGIWPGETCGAPLATDPLENTYWKLTRLGERPVPPVERQREPAIVLHPAEQRVAGSGGCNRLMGGYRAEANRIAFSQLALTRMACAEGMDTEQAFLDALGRARTWKVTGQHLELYDDGGAQVARFEARALR